MLANRSSHGLYFISVRNRLPLLATSASCEEASASGKESLQRTLHEPVRASSPCRRTGSLGHCDEDGTQSKRRPEPTAEERKGGEEALGGQRASSQAAGAHIAHQHVEESALTVLTFAPDDHCKLQLSCRVQV